MLQKSVTVWSNSFPTGTALNSSTGASLCSIIPFVFEQKHNFSKLGWLKQLGNTIMSTLKKKPPKPTQTPPPGHCDTVYEL